MTVEKITVSLPAELVAEARLAVALGKAASVSAYVAQAMARHKREDDLAALLDEMDEEFGPPSDEAYEWAAAQLGLPPGSRPERAKERARRDQRDRAS